jgi:hypothetical protein
MWVNDYCEPLLRKLWPFPESRSDDVGLLAKGDGSLLLADTEEMLESSLHKMTSTNG